ncbi:DUF4822 domain-containing protein [Nocardia stercoris]|uniref:DUF4822 domain-containing protein n=1 Tax=Nocardia stercoris TaxID=2483361 RepID=A0A3M2LFK4_9NOCA|nr:DUF4822 domain-containing protein [Nocardia stercoris]RMI33478.1 DUF4822 domain-containing protein [Nocardia stercoris]
MTPIAIRTTGALAAVAVCGLVTACGSIQAFFSPTTPVSSPPPPTVAADSLGTLLTATPWQTTAVQDPHGDPVPLTDDRVRPYLGFVYFARNGTFTAFGLDDAPAAHGDWWLTPDGKTRTMITKNPAGQEVSRRDVDVVILTDKEFVDRVRPDPTRNNDWFDIVHTPTDHRAPGT